MVVADSHDLGAFTKLFDAIYSLGVETTKFDEGLGEEFLLLSLMILLFFFFLVHELSLYFKLSKDTRLSATDESLEVTAVVKERDVVGDLRFTNSLSEGPLLLDLFFQDL